MTQRFIWLEILERATVPNNRIRVQSPPNGKVAPPGYYMLFIHSHAVCEPGHEICTRVPSKEGKWIRLQ